MQNDIVIDGDALHSQIRNSFVVILAANVVSNQRRFDDVDNMRLLK